jgi:hypothetical protein
MKPCPLFESIEHVPQLEMHVAPETQTRHFWRGVAAAQQALPREAIEAAINALEHRAFYARVSGERAEINYHIDQLLALLPTVDP